MSDVHRTPAMVRLVRRMRPVIAASLPAPCVQPKCQRFGVVYPDQAWDVGHIVPVALAPELALDPSNLGPSHRRCNRSDGGKEGARRSNRTRRAEPSRESAW